MRHGGNAYERGVHERVYHRIIGVPRERSFEGHIDLVQVAHEVHIRVPVDLPAQDQAHDAGALGQAMHGGRFSAQPIRER